MVRHTHQDFLWAKRTGEKFNINTSEIPSEKLERIRDVGTPKDLFDFTSEGYIRKISLSKLDRDIDDEKDWKSLISKLEEIDNLYLVDDRIISNNPIIERYDKETKTNYAMALNNNGIKYTIVSIL